MFNQKSLGNLLKLFIISYTYAVLFTRITTSCCQCIYDLGMVWSLKIKSDGGFN